MQQSHAPKIKIKIQHSCAPKIKIKIKMQHSHAPKIKIKIKMQHSQNQNSTLTCSHSPFILAIAFSSENSLLAEFEISCRRSPSLCTPASEEDPIFFILSRIMTMLVQVIILMVITMMIWSLRQFLSPIILLRVMIWSIEIIYSPIIIFIFLTYHTTQSHVRAMLDLKTKLLFLTKLFHK